LCTQADVTLLLAEAGVLANGMLEVDDARATYLIENSHLPDPQRGYRYVAGESKLLCCWHTHEHAQTHAHFFFLSFFLSLFSSLLFRIRVDFTSTPVGDITRGKYEFGGMTRGLLGTLGDAVRGEATPEAQYILQIRCTQNGILKLCFYYY